MRSRHLVAIIVLILSMSFLFCGCEFRYRNIEDAPNENLPMEIFSTSGAWITSVWNIDYPTRPTTNSSQLKKEIDEIVSKAFMNGLNTLFFQVRPCADALYKSEIFPWSRFLTGTQGLAPSNGFDPLKYLIEQCHDKNIKLHAWINPYRITVLSSDVLLPTHPANISPEATLMVNDRLFWNPGEPKALQLILESVCEIIRSYKVDGIHYDDYFYPEEIQTEDLHTFLKYGKAFKSIADWRRNNIDELIRQTYNVVKEIDPNIVFGVSPSGIWANKFNHPLGSDTWGFESYNAIYADSRGWVKKGYIDYIAPQLYWYIGQPGSDFLTMLNWWVDVCADTHVKLYIGLAGYKVGGGGAWNISNEFDNQMALSSKYADGFIIFSFGDLR